MFKRIRRLKISLAAKCQILFGVAVVAIITAALAVPWQRTEQLTEQLDQRAARTLVEHVLMEHVAQGKWTQPRVEAEGGKASPFEPPMLAAAGEAKKGSFQARAMAKFARQPELEFYSRDYLRKDGNKGYRYARPLYATQECLKCHSVESGRPPTTQQAGFMGVVTVDIQSQIETSQLLLNRASFAAAGLLAGLLAVAAFYLITTRLILQPVRVLQETAEKVSEGDLNIRSDISTGDEFQQLAETFNVMLTNLKLSADQLQASNKALDLRLGQLSETNVALYESNRLKSEFLANVSHELRTPLNSILGFAELLKDSIGPGMDPKQARYIQNILNSGRNLLELINDLLDLAKIEAGKMEVRAEPLSLPDVFEGLENILKPQMQGKELTLDWSVEGDVPILQTDPAKLQQVLYNFLSNAIKFSPAKGKIVLSAEKQEEKIRIAVTDQGPGVEPEKQRVIFEKFRQIDGSVTRQHGGSGLGLSISRELATLLGGTIGVESEIGKGATFWITLPQAIQGGTRDIRGKLVMS